MPDKCNDQGLSVHAAQQGVRRALVECVLRLSCAEGVLQEFQMHLPALDAGEQEQYDAVTELYGSPRMLLAVLSRQLLKRVRLLFVCACAKFDLRLECLKTLCACAHVHGLVKSAFCYTIMAATSQNEHRFITLEEAAWI